MLWTCLDCGAGYAESLASCPQCGSTERRPDWQENDEEDSVPKIDSAGTASGGAHPVPGEPEVTEDGTEVTPEAGAPADGTAEPAQDADSPAEGKDAAPEDDAPGGEQPSAGDDDADESGEPAESGNGDADEADSEPATETATPPAKRARKTTASRTKAAAGGNSG